MKLPFKRFSCLAPITVLIFISACGGTGGEENLTVSDIVDPISLPDTSIPSCINYSSIENTQYCTFSKDGLAREFYIYVPNGYSENISPVFVLTAIIPPGDTLPLNVTFFSSTGLTPVSDAIVIILLLSIWNLAGLSPFLSRTQIAHSPSDITIPAGPSHGSICIELYS
jgi:hypothetical protein